MPAVDEVGPARLGIDFGTSTTVAMVSVPGRTPRSLLFDGSPLLPSAICLDPTGRILVGRDALHTAMARPAAFEPHPKQRVDEGTVLLGDTELAVSRLFGAVLDRVLLEAANVTGDLPERALEVVVTCPAGWGSARRATLLAAAPPGTRLVEEPVAAAHAFVDSAGHAIPDGGTAVVYDFGAGTFDAAVVRRTGDGFAVVASRGLPDCGGLDLDAAIVAHLAAAVPDAVVWGRLDAPVTATDRRARQQLWANVRAAKEMLSRATTTQVYLPLLDIVVPLGRQELDGLAAPILDRTVAAVREVLELAGVGATALDAIFLAGGSSRMPAVVTHLHRAFGFAPVTVEQPELAVAEGCLRATATSTAVLATTDATATGSVGAGAAVDNTPVTLGDTVEVGAVAQHRERFAELTPSSADDVGLTTRTSRRLSPSRWVRAGGEARVRAGRIALSVAAGGAVLALVAMVFVVVSPGGDEPRASAPGPSPSLSPTPAPTPSPSYPPGIDPCLLGTWRITSSRVIGYVDDIQVQYVGGAGVVETYRADGTSSVDYSKMEPRVGTLRGVTWSEVDRGKASGTYYAENGKITGNITKSDAVGTLRRNGKINATAPLTFFLEPTTYRCSGDRLISYSEQGNFSDEAVRISGPPTPAPSVAASGGNG
ncbi:Hsp70 family protein [Micromonospora sp. NPDC050417]|uniref:Hsp70 family protein n=1 Tax=Micromonospora sp. NPDC050417 TaxID=3364280 RepID=UPI0037AB250D